MTVLETQVVALLSMAENLTSRTRVLQLGVHQKSYRGVKHDLGIVMAQAMAIAEGAKNALNNVPPQ